MTDKEIAASLGMTEHTVGDHLKAVYRKLGAHCRVAAVLAWQAWMANQPVTAKTSRSQKDTNLESTVRGKL